MTSDKNTQKGLYIKNFGCQMNVYDGDRMQEMMSSHNYDSVNSVEDADLVILNTCHIREKATEKIYSELGRIKKNISGKKEKTIIAVAGCVAQAEGEELVKRSIDVIKTNFGKKPIKISAQAHLQNFYKKNGFKSKGETYLEDGIPHIAMYLIF